MPPERPQRKTLHRPSLARELWKKKGLRGLMMALLRARLARPPAETCRADLECYPGIPYHRHMLWKVAFYSGARLVPFAAAPARGRPRRRLWWPDTTVAAGGVAPEPAPPPAWREGALNAAARDERKSTVGRVFEEAFGYALAVDPVRHVGRCVAKSDGLNGAHDGRIVDCPIPAATPDTAYQVLVDNEVGEGMVEDCRVPVVGGRIPFVYRKRRSLARRFANENAAVTLAAANALFSAAEIDRLLAFARLMGLGLGGEIDVLRDAGSGRLYVVDANWTSWGPPRPLALAEAVTAVRAYAAALAILLDQPD